MAWAYKRGSTYYVGYRDERGKKVQRASKARTLTEARRLAEELERRSERIRLGIDAPVAQDILYREGVQRYLASLPPEYRSRNTLEGRFRNRILPHLGDKPIRRITPADVQAMLAANADASPQTREHLRVAVQASYTFFVERLKVASENPAAQVPKVRIPKRHPKYLTLEEIPRLLAEIPEHWLCAVLVALGTAARKSEILALKKTNVRLAERVLVISESLGSNTTKGGKERRVPIPEWLVPHLERQLQSAPGPLLFPNPDGRPWSKTVRLHDIIRRALVRAEIVDGWEHVCRRCGWKSEPPRDTKTPFPCPECGMKTWPKGIAKPIRFKELRSTWATHAAASTGDIRFVQTVLGHGDPRVTTERYAYALPQHIQAQANRVALPVSQMQATRGETEQTAASAGEVADEKPKGEQADAK